MKGHLERREYVPDKILSSHKKCIVGTFYSNDFLLWRSFTQCPNIGDQAPKQYVSGKTGSPKRFTAFTQVPTLSHLDFNCLQLLSHRGAGQMTDKPIGLVKTIISQLQICAFSLD